MNISDEEKIKLMLESMMTNVELIEKNTRGLDAKALKKELQAINQKAEADTTKFTGLESLEQKIIDIQKSLEAPTSNTVSKVSNHHYLWFFPDLREWLKTINHAKAIVFLILVSVSLLVLIAWNFKNYQSYRSSHYKYQYLFYVAEDQESLVRYDQEWQNDSLYAIRVNYVNQQDAMER